LSLIKQGHLLLTNHGKLYPVTRSNSVSDCTQKPHNEKPYEYRYGETRNRAMT